MKCQHKNTRRFTLREYPGFEFQRCNDCGKVRETAPRLARHWGTIDEHTPDSARALVARVARRLFDETTHYRGC